MLAQLERMIRQVDAMLGGQSEFRCQPTAGAATIAIAFGARPVTAVDPSAETPIAFARYVAVGPGPLPDVVDAAIRRVAALRDELAASAAAPLTKTTTLPTRESRNSVHRSPSRLRNTGARGIRPWPIAGSAAAIVLSTVFAARMTRAAWEASAIDPFTLVVVALLLGQVALFCGLFLAELVFGRRAS